MPKAKLLVVEDEPNLLLGIRDILELDDYEVLTAQNGQQALEVLESTGEKLPNLIVSDIMMPKMDGIELLKKVRNERRWIKIPFIFLTARGEKSDVQQGKMLGVDDYLIKPFDADDLLVAVQAKLERATVIEDIQASEISNVKRNILTILNHEMRTPLTLVVAYADMLKDSDAQEMDGKELVTFLKEINSGADRLRRLIENFILLVELETGDAAKTYDWRKYKFSDYEEVINIAHNQVVASHREPFECVINVAEGLPPIMADREYLIVMLRELLDNAVKFSRNTHDPEIEGGPVVIEVEQEGSYISIHVIDRGRGIPESKLKDIWQPFHQIDRDEHEDQGAGSGLAIVKDLVKLHRAEVVVESTYRKGSKFTLKIPTV